MHLDAVEAGCERVARAGAIPFDDAGQLVGVEGARCLERHQAGQRDGFAGRADRRRRDRQLAARLQGRMRDAADVPQLQEDAAAVGVYRIGHFLPAGDLLGRVDARRARVTLSFRADLGRLGDQESGCPRVVHSRSARTATGHCHRRAVARQRCHHDAAGQAGRTEVEGLEQGAVMVHVDCLRDGTERTGCGGAGNRTDSAACISRRTV